MPTTMGVPPSRADGDDDQRWPAMIKRLELTRVARPRWRATPARLMPCGHERHVGTSPAANGRSRRRRNCRAVR
jgi:hypothetical protein